MPDRHTLDKGIAQGHVAVARVIGAHGLRGDLTIEALAPESCLQPGTRVLLNNIEHKIVKTKPGGKHPLLKLSGLRNREAALSLRGCYIQVVEDALPPLPEGEYYRFQLIGLTVSTAKGQDVGHIVDVIATGANDAYEIDGPLGTFLIPATAEVIQDVDLASRTMTITPLPGLLPSD